MKFGPKPYRDPPERVNNLRLRSVRQEIVGKPNLSIVVLLSFTPCFSWVARKPDRPSEPF